MLAAIIMILRLGPTGQFFPALVTETSGQRESGFLETTAKSSSSEGSTVYTGVSPRAELRRNFIELPGGEI